MTEGDFVVITRGEPHVFYSDRRAKPLRIIDIDRSSPRLGVVRHGSRAKPLSTMICGNFTVSRPLFGSVLELLPPVLLLKPTADGGWLEAILRRMVSESALERPGQRVALSRLTEVLFVEVLRSWIASLSPGQGGWLGAISDPHIGPALKLIHENPERPWTLSDLGHRVGLGRSVFSARFTKLVGQSMHRYVIERRMAEAAFLLETSDEPIARIASRVGYETAAAFSKLFHRYHGLSPGRYRAARRSDGGRTARGRSGSRSRRLTLAQAEVRAVLSFMSDLVALERTSQGRHTLTKFSTPARMLSSVASPLYITTGRVLSINPRTDFAVGQAERGVG